MFLIFFISLYESVQANSKFTYTKYFYNPIDNIYANPKINYLSI